jgi:hypothetical protein
MVMCSSLSVCARRVPTSIQLAAAYSTDFTISSITFFASPKTIMVLSM